MLFCFLFAIVIIIYSLLIEFSVPFREELGYKVICEQVSHHPPISAFHVSAASYTVSGAINPKLKFWGKSVEISPKGT